MSEFPLSYFNRRLKAKMAFHGIPQEEAAKVLKLSLTAYNTILNHGTFSHEQRVVLEHMVEVNSKVNAKEEI